jgi:hypothetical protein
VNDNAETDRIFFPIAVGLLQQIVSQNYNLNTFLSTVLPNAYWLFKTSLGKKDHEHQDRRQNPLYRY